MKNLASKILTFTIAMIFVSVVTDCTTNTSEVRTAGDFSLVSPNGIALADNLDGVKDIIIYNSGINLNKKDIEISSINYNETDRVSFGIVDFTAGAEDRSMLVPLRIDEGLALFVDNKNVYIREVSTIAGPSLEGREDVIFTNQISAPQQTAVKTAYVCNGGCCKWAQINEEHYHCGCPLTAGDGN